MAYEQHWPFNSITIPKKIGLKIDYAMMYHTCCDVFDMYEYAACTVCVVFLRTTAVPAGTAEARISYGNSVCLSVCPSVCLSVTTRWYTKPRWDRDSGSSPYDSLESLVANEVIWCRWMRRFPSNEGIKGGYPFPLEIVILPLLAHLAWKRLHKDADLLHIIASTADELSSRTNIDDLERPWTPKIGVLVNF